MCAGCRLLMPSAPTIMARPTNVLAALLLILAPIAACSADVSTGADREVRVRLEAEVLWRAPRPVDSAESLASAFADLALAESDATINVSEVHHAPTWLTIETAAAEVALLAAPYGEADWAIMQVGSDGPATMGGVESRPGTFEVRFGGAPQRAVQAEIHIRVSGTTRTFAMTHDEVLAGHSDFRPTGNHQQ